MEHDNILMRITGNRQVGKTTLLINHLEYLRTIGMKVLLIGATQSHTRRLDSLFARDPTIKIGRGYRTDIDIIAIDEASYFKDEDFLRNAQIGNSKTIKYILVG